MNLHDWIDELCDLLEIETEADEALIADLERVTVSNVASQAGPVSAYLLGVAVGQRGATPDEVEEMALQVQELAEAWDRPGGASDPAEEVSAAVDALAEDATAFDDSDYEDDIDETEGDDEVEETHGEALAEIEQAYVGAGDR